MRKLRFWLGLFAASGCAIDGEPETSEVSEELNAFATLTWPQPDIPVCWEVAGRNAEKAIVRDAIRATWEAEANINFLGWGTCTPGASGIRIEVADVNPHVANFGTAIDGVPNGLTLNFDYVARPCTNGTVVQCMRRHAVHEFGHALGFLHEQNRADNPLWCPQQAVEGDATVGAWDLESVMNYCNPNPENGAQLSPTDIWGVQRFYGARKPLSAHHGAGRTAIGARTTFDAASQSERTATWSPYTLALDVHPNAISSTPAIVTSGYRTHAIVRGFDGRLWGKVFDGASWSGFIQLGAEQVMGDPVAVARGTDGVDVFVRGTDRRLYSKTFNGATWSGYAPVGWSGGALPLIAGTPSVVVRGPARIDVFARSTDNILHYTTWDGALWSAFAPLRTNPIASNPVAVSWDANRLDVFVRGIDGALYTMFWDGFSWNGFFGLGGEFTGDPAVVSWGANRIDVFVRGMNRGVWTRSWTGNAWNGFSFLGGETPAGPSVTSNASNRLDLFVVGMNRALWKTSWNGAQWSGFANLGGSVH